MWQRGREKKRRPCGSLHVRYRECMGGGVQAKVIIDITKWKSRIYKVIHRWWNQSRKEKNYNMIYHYHDRAIHSYFVLLNSPLNYSENIRLRYFASEHTMHWWTPKYIASRKNTKQSASTALTVMRQLSINFPIPLPTVWQHQIQTTASSTKYTQHYTTATNHLQYVSHEQTWQDCPKTVGPRKVKM